MRRFPSRHNESLSVILGLTGIAILFFLQSDSFSSCGITGTGGINSFNASFGQDQRKPVKAPDFSLQDSKGQVVQLSKLRRKVVVVNFWATWCGPCRAEIPGFLEVYDKYKSKGLEIIGISLDEYGWEAIHPFVKKYKISYPVVLGDSDAVLNYGGIRSIPTTVLVDREGFIVYGHIGYFPQKLFAQEIEKIL